MQELAKKFEEEGSIIVPSTDLAGISALLEDDMVKISKVDNDSGDDVIDAEFSEAK